NARSHGAMREAAAQCVFPTAQCARPRRNVFSPWRNARGARAMCRRSIFSLATSPPARVGSPTSRVLLEGHGKETPADGRLLTREAAIPSSAASPSPSGIGPGARQWCRFSGPKVRLPLTPGLDHTTSLKGGHMRSFDQRSTSSVHPNAFTIPFLSRLAEQDEPPTAGDADVAGPWRIEPVVWRGGHGFGLFRIGETLARGFTPVAVFPSRWLALLAAAVLPGTGRDPLLRIDPQADADGVYPLLLPGKAGDDVAGRLQLFDERLVDALNVAVHLLQSPESL